MTSLIQLNFFDKLDPRPLPLLTAETWNFHLTYVDQDNNPSHYLYLARDWYMGLGGDKGRWSKSKADWLTGSQPVMMEVKRERRKPEMLEFVDAQGLYSIAARMPIRSDRPQLDEIKAYLAHAGVKFDEIRRNPEQAAYELDKVADNRYANVLRKQGYSDEQIPALLIDRKEDVTVRNQFIDMLKNNIEGAPQYSAITNAEYVGMFHRTAEQLSNQLGTKQVRENMHPLAKNFCRIAELSCIEKVKQLGRKMTNQEAYTLMNGIAQSLGVNVDWLQKQLGIDIATGRPLLDKWTRENMD